MKINNKFSLALIALVGIGVFALPATTALFSGQHSFYNIDATGNQIPCQKCHGDVKAELSSGLSTTTGTKGPHADFKCEYCHRAENGFASGDDAYAKITYTNSTTDHHIFLVTTIQNHEQGNFPKTIVWFGSMNVDNWETVPLAVQDLNGNQFNNNTVYLDANGQYAGSLSTNGVAGEVYNFDFRDEIATTSNGTPKDTLPATQMTAFNAHAVTWFVNNTENLTGAGSREVTPGTRYHAASLVSCLECHGGDQNKGAAGYELTDAMPYNHGNWLLDASDPNSQKCSNCHYGSPPDVTSVTGQLAAGGFGLTDAADGGNANDTGAVEAHKNWVTSNDSTDLSRHGYGAANSACVACHTHVAVQINFKKGYLMQFNASEDALGNYTVSDFKVNGTVNITTYGNESGNTFAVSNSTYSWANDTTLYINGTNVTVTGLKQTTNDSAAALTQ